MEDNKRGMTRRQVLGAVGTTAAAGLAGCSVSARTCYETLNRIEPPEQNSLYAEIAVEDTCQEKIPNDNKYHFEGFVQNLEDTAYKDVTVQVWAYDDQKDLAGKGSESLETLKESHTKEFDVPVVVEETPTYYAINVTGNPR